MSLNEEKDGEDPNKPIALQNVQDDLVHVIYKSLNNIATQVDNINKQAEGIIGSLSKEVDKISCRYNALQECITKLNNNLIEKETSKESLQATKSSQSASIQAQQDYPSNPLPAKTCETRDASVQTSSLYMSIPYGQHDPQVLAVPTLQDDTDCLIIPYYQDNLMISYCQDNEQDLMIPYLIDSGQGLVMPSEASYYFDIFEKRCVPRVKEQVRKKFRKKKKHVDHPSERENGPQITVMGNDNTVDHTPPTCIDRPPLHMDLPAEQNVFSTYQINEISKVLTQAVGKVLVNSPHPRKKQLRYLGNKEACVHYGVGKREINPQVQIQNHPKPEVFVSPTEPASLPLPPDWLTTSRDSKTEYPASKIHSQTQFPSPVLRTSATHHHNCHQASPEVDIQTAEEKEDLFPFPPPPPPPKCYETIAHNLPKQDNEKEETSSIFTSPVFLRRSETKEGSDLLAHASFVQSPPSLVYPTSRPVFPQSPRLSATKSPRPSVLSIPRPSHQSPTRYTGITYSKSSSAVVPRHSRLETHQNSIPLSESFSQSSTHSVSPARCSSAYSPTRSVFPRFSDEQSRFSIPSSGKTYIEQSTDNRLPPSQTSLSLKPTKAVPLQSLISFPQSASSTVSSPKTRSLFHYSEDPVSSDPKQPPAFNKEMNSPMDSIRKDVLVHQTEECCILKAQIKFSKK